MPRACEAEENKFKLWNIVSQENEYMLVMCKVLLFFQCFVL